MTKIISDAQKEVWEWKEAVYKDIKDMTPSERIAFFRSHAEQMIKDHDLHSFKVRKDLYPPHKTRIVVVSEEKEEYFTEDDD